MATWGADVRCFTGGRRQLRLHGEHHLAIEAGAVGGRFSTVTRSVSADQFALFADGEALGFVKSVSGGNIKGEVATHNMGPDNFAKKELGAINYEDITVETGMEM